VPWRYSCRGTHNGSLIVSRRLCLGQDESRRVQLGPCQYSRSWLHRAMFSLVALVLAGRVHTLPMQALDSDLVPFCSHGQSIEVVIAEYDCGYLGSASVCRRCLRFWCDPFLSLLQSFADTTSQIPWVGSVVSCLVSKSLSCTTAYSVSSFRKPVAWWLCWYPWMSKLYSWLGVACWLRPM